MLLTFKKEIYKKLNEEFKSELPWKILVWLEREGVDKAPSWPVNTSVIAQG
jgi:hypothetical protein